MLQKSLLSDNAGEPDSQDLFTEFKNLQWNCGNIW